eukprot:g3930.t1
MEDTLAILISRGSSVGSRHVAAALCRRVETTDTGNASGNADVAINQRQQQRSRIVDTCYELVVYDFLDGEHFAQLESLLVQFSHLRVLLSISATDPDQKKLTDLFDACNQLGSTDPNNDHTTTTSSQSYHQRNERTFSLENLNSGGFFTRQQMDIESDIVELLRMTTSSSTASASSTTRPLALHPIGSILLSPEHAKGKQALGALIKRLKLIDLLQEEHSEMMDSSSSSTEKSTIYRNSFRLNMGNLNEHLRLDLAACKALNLFPDGNYQTNSLNPNDHGSHLSLYSLLNCCKTKMGSRLLARWLRQPLTNVNMIQRRQAIVKLFCDDATELMHDLRQEILVRFPDIEELLRKMKISRKKKKKKRGLLRDNPVMTPNNTGDGGGDGSTVSLRDIYLVYRFACDLPAFVNAIREEQLEDFKDTNEEACNILLEDVSRPVESNSKDLEAFVNFATEVIDIDHYDATGQLCINAAYDPELQRLKVKRDALMAETSELLDTARQTWGRGFKAGKSKNTIDGADLKLEDHKVHGLVYRVTTKHKKKARNLKNAISVQVLTAGFLFTTRKLKPIARELKEIDEAYELKQEALVAKAGAIATTYFPVLESLNKIISYLDVLISFAHVSSHAIGGTYVQPTLIATTSSPSTNSTTPDVVSTTSSTDSIPTTTKRVIELKQCRHPVMEISESATNGAAFIPNDYHLDEQDRRFILITGPNMGGKSTYIRQLGVNVVLAQIGCFVPAESATLSVMDAILCRVGAGDAQLRGISTFMAEMLEASAILSIATPNSLVIVDELGRGTSTYDGFGLAWAISEHLVKKTRAFTLFATHFHELTALAQKEKGVANMHATALTDDTSITMLYEMRDGSCDESFGIHVAELAKFPTKVIEGAKRKAKELEKTRTSTKNMTVSFTKRVQLLSEIEELKETKSLTPAKKARIETLLRDIKNTTNACRKGNDSRDAATRVVEKNQLGAVNGVFVPCLLNILGAVLFLRIGYSVGYAGIVWTLIIFLGSFTTTVLTALSFSAIVTNGKMQGGGPYFMISRSIGPAFGGATGLMFWLCYVFNATFNATAFVEDIQHTVISHMGEDAWPSYAFPVLYHGTLVVLGAIAYAGAGCFAKVNTLLFITLVSAILITFGSLLFANSNGGAGRIVSPSIINCTSDPDSIMDHSDPWYRTHLINATYYGPSSSRFMDNLWPHRDVSAHAPRKEIPHEWDIANSLQVVVALVFTSTCGVLEGANLSGDLKNPAKSLPKGTLCAQLTAFTTYIVFACLLAASFDRDSLRCDYYLLQEIALSEYVVVVGMAMATLSTSLGALFGGSRVLQAIARDDIFPYLGIFAKGTRKGDEPRRAVFFTWLLANGFGYIGGSAVNGIAAILTDFFLTAYLFVNISALMLFLTNAPNWRPTFSFTRWWMSLGGALLSIFMMFYLDWRYACLTTGIWSVIFVFVRFRVGETAHRHWGDIGQAILYRLLRQNITVRGLKQHKDNPKFWRSNLMLLAEKEDVPALRFCRSVTREGTGLFIVGTAVMESKEDRRIRSIKKNKLFLSGQKLDGPLVDHMPAGNKGIGTPAIRAKAMWSLLLQELNLNAFHVVGVGSVSPVETYHTMISSAGLGGLVPRTIVIPFGKETSDDEDENDSPLTNGHGGTALTQSSPVKGSYLRIAIDNPPTQRSRRLSKEKKMDDGWSKVQPGLDNFNHALKLGTPVDQIDLIRRVLDQQMNVMLLRNIHLFDQRLKAFSRNRNVNVAWVDVWVPDGYGMKACVTNSDLSLLLQYGHLLARAHATRHEGLSVRLRLIQLAPSQTSHDQLEQMRISLTDLLHEARIPDAGALVVSDGIPNISTSLYESDQQKLAEIIEGVSSQTAMTFLALPTLPRWNTSTAAGSSLKGFHRYFSTKDAGESSSSTTKNQNLFNLNERKLKEKEDARKARLADVRKEIKKGGLFDHRQLIKTKGKLWILENPSGFIPLSKARRCDLQFFEKANLFPIFDQQDSSESEGTLQDNNAMENTVESESPSNDSTGLTDGWYQGNVSLLSYSFKQYGLNQALSWHETFHRIAQNDEGVRLQQQKTSTKLQAINVMFNEYSFMRWFSWALIPGIREMLQAADSVKLTDPRSFLAYFGNATEFVKSIYDCNGDNSVATNRFVGYALLLDRRGRSASSPCLLMEASNSPKNCSSDAGIIPWSESDDQDACRNAAYVIDTSGSDKFMYFTIPFPAVGNGDRSVWIAMTTLAGRPELQICKDYSTPCSSWSDPLKALDGVQRFDRPANQGAQHREIRVRADMWSRYRILWYTDEDTAGEPVIPLEQGFPQVGLYEPDAVRHHLYKWTIAKPTDTYARDALLNHGLEVSIESEYGDVEMLVSLKDKPSTSQKKQDLANCLFSSAYYGTRDIVTLVYYSSDVKTCFDACFARSSDNNHCDMYVKVFTDGPSYDALYEVNAQWRNLDVELTLGEPVLGSAMAGFWRQYHVGNKEGRDITFVLTPIAGDAWLVANKKQNPQKIGNYNGFQRTTAIDRVAKGDYPKNLGAIPKDIYIGVSGSTIRYTNKNCTFSLVAYAKSGPPIKLEEGLPAGNKVSKDEEIHYVIDHDNHATNRRVDDSLKRITITVTATGGGYVALAVNKCTDEECTSRIPTGTSLSDSDYYQDGQATSNPVIVIRDPCAGSSDYCKFMVTVRGLAAQSFTSVSFYTPWSVVSLREAIPFTGQVDQGQYDCFQYTLLQDSKDVEIIVTEIDGDPDVFVSKADPNDTGVTLPNRYNYTWGSLAVGLDIVTIRENDPNACKVDLNENFYCNYLMCVHGYTNSSYSIVIKDNDNTPVLLSDGSPLQGHVDSHTYSYYEFEINEPTLDAHVAVENLSPQGDPDLYVKLIGNVPPADDAPVVSQTSYDYRVMRQGSDDLWIDHSTTAFKTGCNVTAQVNAGTTFRCIMQIAVYGYKSSDYQITAVSSIRPIELNMGRPVTREVPYRYFAKFTVKVDDPSKDLNIAITPQGNGDPDLYVSTDPSLFDCATPQPYTHAVLLCSTPMLASKLTGQQPDAVNINAGQAYDFPAPNATNPYVYVLVLAFTRSKFTIVATQPSKREIATLLPSSPVAGSLHSKDINYYELDARGVDAGKLDLTLKTFSGLAALYVKNMSDTAEENLPMYCCAACLEVPGHSTLQPSPGWNDPHACNQRSYLMDPYTYDYYQYSSYCDMVDIPLDEYQNRFIIAVRGSYYDNTTYTLEAHFPGDVQTLVPGIQVCASVQKATYEYYDMFFFRNSGEDFTVSASIYPLNYAQGFKPKIYLKACVDSSCTRPNATNYDAVGDNFGIVQLIATNQTCGIVCYFQLAVTADADIRYRLKANLDHSWANRQQLTEGIPVPDRLQSGEINYYVFEPPFDAEELTITATPTNLDSQLYMYMKFIDDGDKVINAPSASNHDYFDYSWGGNCQIVATKDDAKWDTSKVAFVALKAVKTSEYLISASTAFYILQSGESMDEEVFPGLYEYFLFTNDNTYGEDIQLDVTHPSAGDTTVCFAYNWTESFHFIKVMILK